MKGSGVLGGRDVDSKWSWVVCFASFLIQFVIIGVQSSFGPFFIEFLREFKRGESSTAWIGSVSFGLTFMNGPLATALCSRWGSRTVTCLGAVLAFSGLILTSFVRSFPLLYLTYGIIFGLGASFSYFASIAGLTSYFKKRLSLAYGITLAGSGAGTPVMIVFLEYMIERWGWRVTFQFTAAISILVFIGGLTYLPIGPSKLDDKSKSEAGSSKGIQLNARACSVWNNLAHIFDPEPFKNRAFAVWVVALGFCIFGYFIPFVFVIRIAKDLGVSSKNSTLLIAYLAITQTVCKIVFGRLGDFAREKRITILQAILFLQAIVTLLCPLASKYGYVVLVVYVVVFGFSDGCWSVMVGMGTELIVGKAMMPRAFGCLYGLISIPLIVGPPIAGVIFDQYGSYDAAFMLAGSTVLFGISLMLIVQRLIRKKAQEKIMLEMQLSSSDNNSSDLVVVADKDSQYLIPTFKQSAEELYSRPSSLIISRVLEDLQWIENTQNALGVEYFSALTVETGSDVVYQLRHQDIKKPLVHRANIEEQLSIISDSSLVDFHREREKSFNSDSGRSTCCDDSKSLILSSQRSRTSSTDSNLEVDIQPCVVKPSASTDLSSDFQNSFYCSFSEDIFSNLMEKTLEEEIIPSRTNSKISSSLEITRAFKNETFMDSQSQNIRETCV